MRIGVDMDGVLADFDKAWTDRYNEDFGTDVEYKQSDHWDALLTVTHFKTYDEWWGWASSKHQDLFLEAPALPGAVEGVNALAEAGHDIVIVTAKPRWAAGHPSSWLERHGIPFDEIHVTSKKSYVSCDVYIDDALHNVVDLMENTDAHAVIQYAAWPYVNGGERVPGAIYATSWDEIVEAVDSCQKSLESRDTQARGRIRRLRYSWPKVLSA